MPKDQTAVIIGATPRVNVEWKHTPFGDRVSLRQALGDHILLSPDMAEKLLVALDLLLTPQASPSEA